MRTIEKNITFNDLVDTSIPLYSDVTLTDMGNIKEVQYMQRCNRQANIIKLDKDHYFIVNGEDKGEIKEFQHTDNRSQSYIGLKKTFKNLRYLINNNFTGEPNELFITLTYAENMTDTKQLYKDFNKFIKRLKYHFDKSNLSFEYLNVIEPQGRGAWHCHLLIKFPTLRDIYIPNSLIAEKWGNGFVSVRRLQSVDNIGAYLTAYLCDISVDEVDRSDLFKACSCSGGCDIVEKDVVTDYGLTEKKKFIKGGRLFLYPSGVNLYRKSKGIVMPDRVRCSYSDIKKDIVRGYQPNYVKGLSIMSEDYSNTIIYEHYNLKRSKNQ